MGSEGRTGSHQRLIGIAVAFTLLVTACGQSVENTSNPTTSAPSADELVAELASAGIGVYDTFDATVPLSAVTGGDSPVQLQQDQLAGFAAELQSGGGVTGGQLDDLVPMPEGAPPFSYLVAGWVSGYDSPEASQALALLGGADAHDWTHPAAIMFPNLVMVLFVSNIAREAGTEAGTASYQPIQGALVAYPIADGTLCSGLSGWINGVLDSIFNAIKIDDDSWVPTIIKDIWNLAVDLAKEVVSGLISILGGAVVSAIKFGLGIVGTLSLMASYMKPWVVTLASDPTSDHLTHEGEATHKGDVTATVKASGASWAPAIVDCAKLAGVDLPSASTDGKPVTWKTESLSAVELATDASHDDKVSDDGTAQLHYETLPESPEDTQNGTLYDGQWQVTATVERLTGDEISNLLDSVVFTGAAGKILSVVLGPLVNQVKAKLVALMHANGSMVQSIGFHWAGQLPTKQASCFPGIWMSIAYTQQGHNTEGGQGIMLTIGTNDNGLIDFTDSTPVYTQFDADNAPIARIDQTGSVQFSLYRSDLGTFVTEAAGHNYSLTPYAWLDEWVQAGEGVQDYSGSGTGPGAELTCDADTLTWIAPGNVSTYVFTKVEDFTEEMPAPPPSDGDTGTTQPTIPQDWGTGLDACKLLTIDEVQAVFPDAEEPQGEDDLGTPLIHQCTFFNALSIQATIPQTPESYSQGAGELDLQAVELAGIGDWALEMISPADSQSGTPDTVLIVAGGTSQVTISITLWYGPEPGSPEEAAVIDLLKKALSRV